MAPEWLVGLRTLPLSTSALPGGEFLWMEDLYLLLECMQSAFLPHLFPKLKFWIGHLAFFYSVYVNSPFQIICYNFGLRQWHFFHSVYVALLGSNKAGYFTTFGEPVKFNCCSFPSYHEMRRKASCRGGNQDNGRGDTAPVILWLQMAQLHAREVQLAARGKGKGSGKEGWGCSHPASSPFIS